MVRFEDFFCLSENAFSFQKTQQFSQLNLFSLAGHPWQFLAKKKRLSSFSAVLKEGHFVAHFLTSFQLTFFRKRIHVSADLRSCRFRSSWNIPIQNQQLVFQAWSLIRQVRIVVSSVMVSIGYPGSNLFGKLSNL